MPLDLQADAAIFFADFAESIRFRVNSAGDAREIQANVNRQPITSDAETPFAGRRAPLLHLMVRNDATHGVVPSEIINDASEVEVAFPLGATARWRRVSRILQHNAGCVLLEVLS